LGWARRLCDLFGRDRQCRILIGAGQVASYGASKDGFHRFLVKRMLQSSVPAGSHAGNTLSYAATEMVSGDLLTSNGRILATAKVLMRVKTVQAAI
jgi:hypothetical protein